jgi:hypothetical protein
MIDSIPFYRLLNCNDSTPNTVQTLSQELWTLQSGSGDQVDTESIRYGPKLPNGLRVIKVACLSSGLDRRCNS